MSYRELHARSAFSFLRGASTPEDLVVAALRQGVPAVALCDRDGVYGSPRLHAAAKEHGLERALVGAELTLECGSVLPVLVKNRTGYQNLCRLITAARLRGTKQQSAVRWDELPQYSEGLVALTGDEEGILRNPERSGAVTAVDDLIHAFGQENVFVEIQRHRLRGEEWRNQWLVDFARSKHLPLLATNGVLQAAPEQRQALDVLTCMRHHTTLDAAGRLLSVNAERHFKSASQMQQLFTDLPEAIENTVRLAERLEFSLENLGYEFPQYADLPAGHSMDSFLREKAYEGAKRRYKTITPPVREQLEKELTLIARLGFSGYFLIVWDLINYCHKHDILVQGRGSAANSVVCYSLEITACDPIKHELLFERFLTENRKSWPDIDLDLPSGDRREQVIQEVYQRYGKHGAAMTANVITYRGRSAMREIGKALSFPADTISRFSSLFANGDFPHTMDLPEQLRQAGLPEDHPRAAVAYRLYQQIRGLPRHMGQHSGGMIICQGALSSVVPLENASMPGRVVAQWDKDDCEDLGIIKVDLLGLGMMAALQDALAMCKDRGHPIELYEIQGIEDPEVYDMLKRADTIGTFQVESRAQMASLPRMKPANFYEIAIQVAIIRPGPIQGGMLNALFARREGTEEVSYLHPDFEPILHRTWGVPLFQEQLLAMAMKIADFSGAEAEELRRALSFHRSHERMDKACIKLRAAMERKQVEKRLADQIIQYVQSFAVYGFPESHAISFAMLAYASCWLKVNRAPEFYACLLNNMPMGFYSSATLIRDAKEHGLKVRPVSVLYSDWDCTIEEDDAVRLGLCMVRGLNETTGRLLAEERNRQFFHSLQDFRERVSLSQAALRTLARIGALNGLVEHRREGLWKIERPFLPGDLPGLAQEAEEESPLPRMDEFERLHADFAGTGVTTGKHPMALIREQLPDITRACDLDLVKEGEGVRIGGLVICRQRPGTAKGVVFVSLEDETGVANAIVLPHVFERLRLTITQETFLIITGKLEKSRGTHMVQTRQVEALDYGAFQMPKSHDFH